MFLTPVVGQAQTNYMGPDIFVCIAKEQLALQIKGEPDLIVEDYQTGKVLWESTNSQAAFLSIQDGKMQLNSSVLPDKIRIKAKENSLVQVNHRTYRGMFVVSLDAKRLLMAVNVLPVEEYLYSVLPQEMPASWPLEALKAQAVAARSFALANTGRRDTLGYDVLASTESQVYAGSGVETATTTQAVKDTFGQAIFYKDKIVEGLFHSSSGGYTESSKFVWGNELPYFQPTADRDQNSPHYKWQMNFTPQELDMAFINAGYNIGKIQAFELSKLNGTPPFAPTADRGVSGRLSYVKVQGEHGWTTIKASELREILRLKSTLFDIVINIPLPDTIAAPIVDQFGNQIGLKEIDVNINDKNSIGLITDSSTIRRLSRHKDEKIIIRGYGWGHGVGLSQWGSKAMVDEALKDLQLKTARDEQAQKLAALKDNTDRKPQDKNEKKAAGKPQPPKPIIVKLSPDFYKKLISYYFKGCSVNKAY